VIREICLIAARHKAAEARAVASTSGCTNPFIGEGATLDGEDVSSSSGSGSSEGASLGGVDASSIYGFSEGTRETHLETTRAFK
jgi:hypothetical protein